MMGVVGLDQQLRDHVTRAIRDAAEHAVVPRFRTLESHAIAEKSPGDWVTDADHECEELLTASLLALEPGIPVVGEEASAADRTLLTDGHTHDRVWVLDPVDGTRAFIEGSPDFATMVALIEHGVTTAAWIWQPIHARMYTAVRGVGAHRDGHPIAPPGDPGPRAGWRGLLRTQSMPSALRTASDAGLARSGLRHTPIAAAGVTYPLAACGELAYALYWRTLPWDHAPGALLAEEAGLTVARLDGTRYRPWDGRFGLLTAATPSAWEEVRSALPQTPEK
jgi:fructose-1,6-bisphosphatase/inositol monophosphatase family enzyme